MTIVCLIEMFQLQQNILICDEDVESATITYTCTLSQMPEIVVNLANEYETNNVLILGAANFAGKLSADMLSMNPNLKIDVKEKYN